MFASFDQQIEPLLGSVVGNPFEAILCLDHAQEPICIVRQQVVGNSGDLSAVIKNDEIMPVLYQNPARFPTFSRWIAEYQVANFAFKNEVQRSKAIMRQRGHVRPPPTRYRSLYSRAR